MKGRVTHLVEKITSREIVIPILGVYSADVIPDLIGVAEVPAEIRENIRVM